MATIQDGVQDAQLTNLSLPGGGRLDEDPYVLQLQRHLQDPSILRGDVRQTRKRQQELLRPYLAFFLRHDNEARFYHRLYREAGILNRHKNAVRDRVSLEDLHALRLRSEELRGDGQRERLTAFARQDLDAANPRGRSFVSSGTSDHSAGPIRVYRSPLTLAMAYRLNGALVDWALGTRLVEGSALLYMAERMQEHNWFAHLGQEILGSRDIAMRYGAHLRLWPNSAAVWHRLRPDVGAIRDFVNDTRHPRYLIGTSPSLHDLLVDNSLPQRALLNMMAGAPPIHLGRRGTVILGGGTKDPFNGDRRPQELVREIAQYVTSDTGKGRVPAPVIDILGLTESASTFVGRTTSPLTPQAWEHFPHPLTYVSYLEGSGAPRPVAVDRHDRGERERQLFFVNFACLDYLEAVVPGDVVAPVYRERMHQHGFIFRHRS